MKTDNNGIYKPTELTYFIAKDESGNVTDKGFVGIGLVWTTKWNDIKKFTNKQEWIDELLKEGIIINEEMI